MRLTTADRQAYLRNAILLCITILVTVIGSISKIDKSAIVSDGAQTLRMGVNLAHEGIISLDDESPFSATMYREPIPVISSALNVLLLDLWLGKAESDSYLSGQRAKHIKFQNIFWMLALGSSAFLFTWVFTASFYASLGGAIIAYLPVPFFAAGPGALGINTLSTELPAAAFLLAGSALLALAVNRHSFSYGILAGIFFGLLALTKASFFYVFIVLACILICGAIFLILANREWRAFWQVAAVVLAFTACVAPWIIRNEIHFNAPVISDRGGVVLYIRTVKNAMTNDEIPGAIYAWAPRDLRSIIGKLSGYSANEFELGGRLQRFNKSKSAFGGADLQAELDGRTQDAVSYYRQARSERVRLEHKYADAQVQNPRAEADEELRARAFEMILARPGRHVAMSFLFLWRGAFFVSIVMLTAFVIALTRKRNDWIVAVLPAAGLVAFYALLSHFIPRYGVPTTPIAVVIIFLGLRISAKKYLWSALFWLKKNRPHLN